MEFITNFDSLLFSAALLNVEQKKIFLHRRIFQILLLDRRHRPV